MFLFFYTGLSKLIDHVTFVAVLHRAPVINKLAGVVSWGLPLAEIGIGLMLFFPVTRIKGLFASFFTLIIFTGYLFVMLVSGVELPCSCGGVINTMSWKAHVIFNLGLVGVTAAALIMYPPYLKNTSLAATIL